MLNSILRLFLGKFEKTVYDTAVTNGFNVSSFYNMEWPDFVIKVNDARVKVESNRIEVNGNSLPHSDILYIMLKRLNKKRKKLEKANQTKQAYQYALDAIKANDKK